MHVDSNFTRTDKRFDKRHYCIAALVKAYIVFEWRCCELEQLQEYME